MIVAHLEKGQRPGDVDAVVVQGFLSRFPDRLQRGKVDNPPNASLALVLLEHVFKLALVGQVDLVELGDEGFGAGEC